MQLVMAAITSELALISWAAGNCSVEYFEGFRILLGEKYILTHYYTIANCASMRNYYNDIIF